MYIYIYIIYIYIYIYSRLFKNIFLIFNTAIRIVWKHFYKQIYIEMFIKKHFFKQERYVFMILVLFEFPSEYSTR